MSIRYLVPEEVVDYIEMHNLYDEDGSSSTPDRGKKAGESAGVASSSSA